MMIRTRLSRALWPVAAIAVFMILATAAPATQNVPTWRIGSTWNYEEQVYVTGAVFSGPGWLELTDWQKWSVEYMGNRTQSSTSID